MPGIPDDTESMRSHHILTPLWPVIGRFVTRFAELEMWVNDIIGLLLNLKPETAQALTSAIMNLSTRLDILNSLIERLDMSEDHRATLQQIADRTIALNAFRNWLIHEPWIGRSYDQEPSKAVYLKRRMRASRGTRKWQTKTFTVTEVETQFKESVQVSRLATDFINSILNERREQIAEG